MGPEGVTTRGSRGGGGSKRREMKNGSRRGDN